MPQDRQLVDVHLGRTRPSPATISGKAGRRWREEVFRRWERAVSGRGGAWDGQAVGDGGRAGFRLCTGGARACAATSAAPGARAPCRIASRGDGIRKRRKVRARVPHAYAYAYGSGSTRPDPHPDRRARWSHNNNPELRFKQSPRGTLTIHLSTY